MPKSLNPNHPVTRELDTQWHKLCAVLVAKTGVGETEITVADIERLTEMIGADGGLVADTRGGRFVLRLVTREEAERLADEAGGRPA